MKDHIWTQLNLGYMVKQIHNKHKTIWWQHVNVGEAMTQHDFIWHQNIVFLNQKHKKRSYRLHNNHAISVQYWAFQHLEDVFFQEVDEVNGVQMPSTLSIQTPSQCQSMFSCGYNGVISMDATFALTIWNFIFSHWWVLMFIASVFL